MIGGVLTISGLTGISLHTPVGALIDATRRKRELIIAGVVLLALSAVAIERRRRPWSVRHLVAPGAGRCDAWHRPLQYQPGSDWDHPGHRRIHGSESRLMVI
jgi:hypothetical protein